MLWLLTLPFRIVFWFVGLVLSLVAAVVALVLLPLGALVLLPLGLLLMVVMVPLAPVLVALTTIWLISRLVRRPRTALG